MSCVLLGFCVALCPREGCAPHKPARMAACASFQQMVGISRPQTHWEVSEAEALHPLVPGRGIRQPLQAHRANRPSGVLAGHR